MNNTLTLNNSGQDNRGRLQSSRDFASKLNKPNEADLALLFEGNETMKYTKKDIGKATIWYAGNEMVLKAIHPKEGIKHGYTYAPYDCYTYGDGVSYYWVLKGGQS